VLRRVPRFTRAGLSVVLIAPGDGFYSGMAPGVLAGEYRAEEARIPVGPLTARSGSRLVVDRAERIDTAARVVHCDSGPEIGFDWVSLDVGSVPEPFEGPGVVAVRPPRNLRELVTRVERAAREQTHTPEGPDPFRVLVAGGGAAACEAALALRACWDTQPTRRPIQIELLAGGSVLLPGWPRAAARELERALAARGIELRKGEGSRVIESAASTVRTADGQEHRFDLLVNATGAVAHPLVTASGLADDSGVLRVDRTLQSVASLCVFGAGDCIAIEGLNLPRSGVHAVRQGRLLARNLLSAATGGRLRPYRLRPWHLQILNLADGTAVAAWGSFHARGRWVRRWKDRIDRGYVRGLRGLGDEA
jgi:selenide,water dikinase